MLNHPPHRLASRARSCRSRRGFTLVELLVVVVIIGIILSFILTAAMDSLRRAEERATQTLISKLENAINDRLDALLQTVPVPTPNHGLLASIYSSSFPNPSVPVFSQDRAAVIANYDYIKREMPDVFYIQDPGVFQQSPPVLTTDYPLNFAANGYPILNQSPPTGVHAPYTLPLGEGNGTNPTDPLGTGEGVYGASYFAAAGIYKNLGYPPQAYDGVDSDGDGLVDNATEVTKYAGSGQLQQVALALSQHKHKTARSEMLYALLVEGSGPLGSVFSRDDFTDKEVRDTDGDGLPEFVDAWGEPLQFYRWPILYHSDLQRGQVITAASQQGMFLSQPYSAVWDEREQDPLDGNQQLLAPGWFYSVLPVSGLPANDSFAGVTGLSFSGPSGSLPTPTSPQVQGFESFFHRLTEPLQIPAGGGGLAWDRSGGPRRAFYSKPLIVSSGPDKALGLFQYSDGLLQTLISSGRAATALIYNENSAMPYSLDLIDYTNHAYTSAPATITGPGGIDPLNPNSYDLQQNGQDDISNHNLQTSVGGG
jgi:prepilin-type N-terminal cleavage/methylation domain-containing protein